MEEKTNDQPESQAVNSKYNKELEVINLAIQSGLISGGNGCYTIGSGNFLAITGHGGAIQYLKILNECLVDPYANFMMYADSWSIQVSKLEENNSTDDQQVKD